MPRQHLPQSACAECDDLFGKGAELIRSVSDRVCSNNPPHPGTVRKLREEGIPLIPHRAVQMTRADYETYDYLIGMDDWNIRNMERIAGGDPENKIHKLLEFAGKTRDIADPWYTGNFDATYEDILEGCMGLLSSQV